MASRTDDPLDGAVWMTPDGPRHFADMSSDELKDVIRHLVRTNEDAHESFRKLTSLREHI